MPSVSNHRRALTVIATAVLLDLAAGGGFAATEHVSLGLGEYWALATATTVGYGDVTPRTAAGHVIAAMVMLTVIPLFAAAFSLVTSGLTAGHVRASEQRIKEHVEARLRQHMARIAARQTSGVAGERLYNHDRDGPETRGGPR